MAVLIMMKEHVNEYNSFICSVMFGALWYREVSYRLWLLRLIMLVLGFSFSTVWELKIPCFIPPTFINHTVQDSKIFWVLQLKTWRRVLLPFYTLLCVFLTSANKQDEDDNVTATDDFKTLVCGVKSEKYMFIHQKHIGVIPQHDILTSNLFVPVCSSPCNSFLFEQLNQCSVHYLHLKMLCSVTLGSSAFVTDFVAVYFLYQRSNTWKPSVTGSQREYSLPLGIETTTLLISLCSFRPTC